ncbi:MAG: RnfABCDGE type electron transport complex subunit D [Oscillospiraceae bacterium]|jgi:electron transport complex protein RnfD|nr:RnfABCDGE type electron transport complex subunit D [Oscillospiraceae bacterium]
MDEQLTVSSSPHIRADDNTRSIMTDMLIALFFPLAVAFYFFGIRVLTLTCVSVLCCILFEYAYRKLLKKTRSIGDMSAAVTGVLLVSVLPPSTPYWMVALGAFFAVVVVKQLYGGLGKNFLNPALAARAFLGGVASLSSFAEPLLENRFDLFGSADAVAAATPLAGESLEKLYGGVTPFTWQDMFLGQIPGSIGEVSAALLLLGGLYLLIRKVITLRIPLAFIGTVALLTFLFPRGGVARLDFMVYNLLAGGLILGAVFMATDYSTSPVTPRGQWLFGIGCGLLTVFMRYFAAMPEGVCYSILLMNTVVWTLDKVGRPRRFGVRLFGKKKEGSGASRA